MSNDNQDYVPDRSNSSMHDGDFRKTTVHGLDDFEEGFSGLLSTTDQLRTLLAKEINGRPFTELSGVTFDHRGAELAGHVLLDTLEDSGYSVGDYDAVGALTAAAVPLADAMLHAAASRGQSLDAFVMDFVYPSIKGPSIRGKRVILLDAWLSQKSYVQTSSLVTLRNGNELSLDCSIIRHQDAQPLAIASLVGGLYQQKIPGSSGRDSNGKQDPTIQVIDPVDGSSTCLPFICAFDENQFAPADREPSVEWEQSH